ncbi:MAG: hypothetical protein K9M95_10655 [Candidatus Cloacimonetes bacterium]|nr:hypothetical protein [Candidatus Cloacimonadota bacterium]MCF7814689.1 hypothetical protein [Candidatus Cloacimonadota bacterium]MCF7884585.1 hypothetical protein [Candidatus Cloacimonadota bacterium]
MKVVINLLILVICISVPLWSSTTLNFQGMLQDAAGIPVNDNKIIQFTIYDALTGGNLLWSESQNSVSIVEGLFAVELGSATAFPADLFDSDDLFITFLVDGEEMTPRQKFLPVPFAIKSSQTAHADTTAYALTLEGVALSGVVQQNVDGNATILGTMTADSFVGDGSGLTGLTGLYNDIFLHKLGPDTMMANSNDAVLNINNDGTGRGISIQSGNDGVYVHSAGSPSTTQTSTGKNGFEISGAEGNGLYVGRADWDGISVNSAGDDGVSVSSAGGDGVYVYSASDDGIDINYAGGDGVAVSHAGEDGVSLVLPEVHQLLKLVMVKTVLR